jgi:uncharacterized protein (DUF983 family)
VPRALVLFARAFTLRCPNCGSKEIFGRRFAIRKECPACGLQVEREEGNFTGSLTINLVVTQTAWVLFLVGTLLLTWPNPPWAVLQWGSVAVMVLTPIVFYPFSKTTWLALDLLFRPMATCPPSSFGRPLRLPI